MSPLKIWTDFDLEKFSIIGVVPMLIPFRGQLEAERDRERSPLAGRYDKLEQEGAQWFELVPLEEAEIAVFPINYPLGKWPPVLEQAIELFGEKVRRADKPTLVFAGGEEDIVDIKLPRPIVLHKSLYASRRRPHEFGIIEDIEDLAQRYATPETLYRAKPARASVGFCGFAPPFATGWSASKIKETSRLLSNYLGYIRRNPSKSAHSYRARALLSLMRQNKVTTDFLIRSRSAFVGAHGQLQPGGSPQSAEKMRREYVDNILDNPYNLCVRGTANESYRLFETLCCGRIPVFVNTDCVLPYHFAIDWKKHVVWVEENQIGKIGELVTEFHDSHGESEFLELQQSNRALWEEYLSPLGFVKHLRLYLDEAGAI